jgi:hypothetical protein
LYRTEKARSTIYPGSDARQAERWKGTASMVQTTIGMTLLLLVGSGPTAHAESAPRWNARFAGKIGWIGGDGVATTALSGKHVLWLFGDTIIGDVKNGGRAGTMVNNSIGLSGRGTDAPIRFIFGKAPDGKPTSFFTPGHGGGCFWPLSAIRVRDKLYLFFIQVEKTDAEGVFAFRSIGNWLISVDNPEAEPDTWRIHQHRLSFARFGPQGDLAWGSAVLAHEGHLYVYGFHEQGKAIGSRKLTIARVPMDRVADESSWRFLSKAGWSDKAADATGVASSLATEFTVTPVPGAKGFVMVYTESGLSARIVGRFAEKPEGPWSDPALLYRCPEMAKDKGVFTYAGKAHGWASNNELLVSYCTNAWDFGRLFRDESVYRPKFVWVKVAR